MKKVRIELAGQRFGRLLVASFAGARCRGKETRPRAFWLCRCDCGNEKVICSADLRQGATQSCGCRKIEASRRLGQRCGGKRPRADLVGQKFGKLTVLKYSENRPTDRPHWLCQCDCGAQKVVSGLNLKNGHTRSCGCLHIANSIKQCLKLKGQPSQNRTHGQSRTAAYRTWASMIQRCENPNNPQWRYYGSRGITVCERWHSFELYQADILSTIGPKPPNMSLDRIDNDKGYSPSNVRWASQKEQVANQRQRKRIDVFTDDELAAELQRRAAIS